MAISTSITEGMRCDGASKYIPVVRIQIPCMVYFYLGISAHLNNILFYHNLLTEKNELFPNFIIYYFIYGRKSARTSLQRRNGLWIIFVQIGVRWFTKYLNIPVFTTKLRALADMVWWICAWTATTPLLSTLQPRWRDRSPSETCGLFASKPWHTGQYIDTALLKLANDKKNMWKGAFAHQAMLSWITSVNRPNSWSKFRHPVIHLYPKSVSLSPTP